MRDKFNVFYYPDFFLEYATLVKVQRRIHELEQLDTGGSVSGAKTQRKISRNHGFPRTREHCQTPLNTGKSGQSQAGNTG